VGRSELESRLKDEPAVRSIASIVGFYSSTVVQRKSECFSADHPCSPAPDGTSDPTSRAAMITMSASTHDPRWSRHEFPARTQGRYSSLAGSVFTPDWEAFRDRLPQPGPQKPRPNDRPWKEREASPKWTMDMSFLGSHAPSVTGQSFCVTALAVDYFEQALCRVIHSCF